MSSYFARCTHVSLSDIVVFLGMCLCSFSLFYYYYCFISCILCVVILSSVMCCFVLSLACVCLRVLDSFSVVTGPRAEIDGMMVVIQSTLRLDFFS